MSEALRLAAWCVELSFEFERRAFTPQTQPCGGYDYRKRDREAEEAADNLRAIAKLLRTLNAQQSLEGGAPKVDG